MDQKVETKGGKKLGPPTFAAFDHVSLPCRDLEEGKRFYAEVMGGAGFCRACWEAASPV